MRNKYRSRKAALKAAKAVQRQEAEEEFVHNSRAAVLLAILGISIGVIVYLLPTFLQAL